MNHAQSAKGLKQSLKAQRARRRPQTGMQKRKAQRVFAQSARETKRHAWGFENKGAHESQVSEGLIQ